MSVLELLLWRVLIPCLAAGLRAFQEVTQILNFSNEYDAN